MTRWQDPFRHLVKTDCIFSSKLLFRNPKKFPAIRWRVKRHTKWHLGVNFHDPDSTSQQDRLHFQFYSLVYKRESFCRK